MLSNTKTTNRVRDKRQCATTMYWILCIAISVKFLCRAKSCIHTNYIRKPTNIICDRIICSVGTCTHSCDRRNLALREFGWRAFLHYGFCNFCIVPLRHIVMRATFIVRVRNCAMQAVSLRALSATSLTHQSLTPKLFCPIVYIYFDVDPRIEPACERSCVMCFSTYCCRPGVKLTFFEFSTRALKAA